jgi:asparagine synthase (glutamine-hydrolysing)
MCGFAGLLIAPDVERRDLEDRARAMTEPIVHRGPDDLGTWADSESGVAFGFRRLAIIDLSEQGHQPMHSATGRFVIVFNGEVYNHGALRAELQSAGCSFRGHSDTEVILAAFERYGVRRAVPRFIGMFAMAVWDRRERCLHLIRDRLGIKPLYVHVGRGAILFGSELKALLADRTVEPRLDRAALASYFRYMYVPAPHTIYRDTYKLLPGHILTLRNATESLPRSEAFWSVEEAAARGEASRFTGSDEEAVSELEALLSDAVRLRMEADVPLGALLSGGIDSSVVVALMQRASERPVRTYTIGFDRSEYDESRHAASVARHIGTDHTELQLTARDALDIVPRLPDMYDEPHADPSQIPTYLVCELARRHVTVALSGDGGDEVFGGYNRYSHGQRWLSHAERTPQALRHMAGAGIRAVSPPGWDRIFAAVAPVLPARRRGRLMGEKLHKIAALLNEDSAATRYRSLCSAWQSPASLVRDAREPEGAIERILGPDATTPLAERMMLADQLQYLPDDLLAKLDRASMAVSLEARVPLLDHRVVEFGWRLPLRMKIRDGVSKWILRQVLHRHVPRELVERPKMGFSVPIAHWMRGSLRPWVEELFTNEALSVDGVLDARVVQREWQQLLAGHDSNAFAIWSVVMFQAWRERWTALVAESIPG